MEWTVKKYTRHSDLRADDYRYWQSRPAHERLAAVSELTTAAWALKGKDVPRLQGPVVLLPRPRR